MTRTGLRGLLRFDPKFLDDRPPFLGVGLHQRAECFRRLLFGRENLLAEIGEPGSHGWIGQRRRSPLATFAPVWRGELEGRTVAGEWLSPMR